VSARLRVDTDDGSKVVYTFPSETRREQTIAFVTACWKQQKVGALRLTDPESEHVINTSRIVRMKALKT
jgi:hypothetical protein